MGSFKKRLIEEEEMGIFQDEQIEGVDTNEKQAYKLYTQGGQGLVYDYVNEGKLKYDKWGYCEPCEWESPIYRGDCLVCGSIYKESEK